MVRPEFAPNVEIPYTNLLRLGRIVRGDVADVRDGRVFLTDGSELPYDFLVVGASPCCAVLLACLQTNHCMTQS